jgi:hypothetical protein
MFKTIKEIDLINQPNVVGNRSCFVYYFIDRPGLILRKSRPPSPGYGLPFRISIQPMLNQTGLLQGWGEGWGGLLRYIPSYCMSQRI